MSRWNDLLRVGSSAFYVLENVLREAKPPPFASPIARGRYPTHQPIRPPPVKDTSVSGLLLPSTEKAPAILVTPQTRLPLPPPHLQNLPSLTTRTESTPIIAVSSSSFTQSAPSTPSIHQEPSITFEKKTDPIFTINQKSEPTHNQTPTIHLPTNVVTTKPEPIIMATSPLKTSEAEPEPQKEVQPPTIPILQEESETTGKLHPRAKAIRVPSSRSSRLFQLGGLGVGLALGGISEQFKRTLFGTGTSAPTTSVLLTDANAERIATTLSRMRGAALKLGQLLSFQDESLIPASFQAIMERAQQGADFMTERQLNETLEEELGKEWSSLFLTFDKQPLAAASIGQVHRARTAEGQEVVVKVQYPGVAQSIDSDIRNLSSLVTLTGLAPKGLYVEKVLESARLELRQECDYESEAQNQMRFYELIGPHHPDFFVPAIIKSLSTKRVLTSEFAPGQPFSRLANLPPSVRDRVGTELLSLCLKELFEWKFMQTDPNWTNFFYDRKTEKISVIDFGACRDFTQDFAESYLRLVYSAAEKDEKGIIEASLQLGMLSGEESRTMLSAHASGVMIVGEPFAEDEYDFNNQDMTGRIRKLIPVILENRIKSPPEITYALHRKLSGAFLLCSKLKAKVRCRKLLLETYKRVIQSNP